MNIIDKALKIPGWTTRNELIKLWEVHSNPDIKKAVEIGAYCGRSTVVIANALNQHGGRLTVIDHFNGSREHKLNQTIIRNENIYDEFEKNTSEFANITILKIPSQIVNKTHIQYQYDSIFLDSEHDYNSVKRDLNQWMPLTDLMICHDNCMEWPGVYRAISERLTQDLKLVWQVESLAALRRKK